MSLEAVRSLVQQRVGLDLEAPGSPFEAVVTGQMSTRRLTDAEYAHLLLTDPTEWQALLDGLVVPETWFFRGGIDLFVWLARQVAGWVADRATWSPVRLLSLPCSSGEEAYSLAIALAEAEVRPDGWQIEGVDLSSRQIERATAGQFGAYSFRQTDPGWWRPHFRVAEGQWEIEESLRRNIHFQTGNLLDPDLLTGQRFDLILCRNLFIYLHAEARARAEAALDRLLAPEGILVLGHADSLDRAGGRFERVGPAGYFLYRRAPGRAGGVSPPSDRTTPTTPFIQQEGRRAGGVSPPSDAATPEVLRLTRGAYAPRSPQEKTRGAYAPRSPEDRSTRGAHAPRSPEDRSTRGAHAPRSPVSADLSRARSLADAGRLVEALVLTRAILAQGGPTAEVYALLGVLHAARGERDDARAALQRALYLDPEHREALLQLMLLHRQEGEMGRAELLRRRLERIGEGESP